ncbi:MAG: CAP domain-containing protein, partial [Thermoanaerobaculia bacterium]
GENIARGAFSVEEALEGWSRSREHRKNLLHDAYTHLGVGYATGRDADGWTVVWVQDFARPR